MSFSFKKIFLISLMVISITSVSLILIKETKAGCGVGCWVKRTCTQPHDESTCSSWSEPYDCHIVCDGGGGGAGGGSGPGSAAGGSGSSGGGGGSGSPASTAQSSLTPLRVNNKECSLESVDSKTGAVTPICKFPVPEYIPTIFGGIPLTGSTTTNININFSGTLPTNLRAACTEGMTVLNNFFAHENIPLHIYTDPIGEGNISITYDDPGKGYRKNTAAINQTTPPTPSQRIGTSKITFNMYEKGNEDTSPKGYIDQVHTCIHEVAHSLGVNDVPTFNDKDNYHSETMGSTFLYPLKSIVSLDFCTQVALTYTLKYGTAAYKRDVPCVGDPKTLKKLQKWLTGVKRD